MNYAKIIRDTYTLSNHNLSNYFRMDSVNNQTLLYKTHNNFGVVIMADQNIRLNEKFNQLNFYTNEGTLNGEMVNLLHLTLNSLDYFEQFIIIAADFIELSKRTTLKENPLEWWNHWKELIGNAVVEKSTYSILAELLVLNYLQKNHSSNTPKWLGYTGGTYDIHTKNKNIEVKASINKFDTNITISNQYQLNTELINDFYVLGFEASANDNGISIDDAVSELSTSGYPLKDIETGLQVHDLPADASARREKYILLSCKKYNLQEAIPDEVKQSMDKFFDFDIVRKVNAELDLANIEHEKIDLLSV
ncbi:PD-(D/E)XK motif protein [Gracilibacillus alcaliphilus]|uniref:PD-(D/E)XK motif protein n=1 Tax=Gracilibacillus alcaliphilus TaxID=1401441 RepID=UPI0019566D83|nr:PD-(D/E)XK motif protein [Gracilibacillus alcaliphilus]MBM7679600.1 hypothetical protein [Gracilibacillus alcaliphilus]